MILSTPKFDGKKKPWNLREEMESDGAVAKELPELVAGAAVAVSK